MTLNRDWDWLAGYVSARFDCCVTAEQLEKATGGIPIQGGWSEGTLLAWIKNRLSERGIVCAGRVPQDIDLPPVPLHVFFIHLRETEDMLARLPEAEQAAESTARSKIAKTPLVVHPVNRVAARIVDARMRT